MTSLGHGQWAEARPLWRRALEQLASINTWRDLVNEWSLRSSNAYVTPEPISFSLPTEKLRHVSIRWPARSPWPGTFPFGNDLRVGLTRFAPVHATEVPQPYPGVILFQVQIRDRTFDVSADFRDYPDVIQEEALQQSVVYFKMQFSREGYRVLGDDANKILPGGYVTSGSKAYSYMQSLRSRSNNSKDFEVYGRFGLRYSRDLREKAIRALQTQTQFRYQGGARRVRYSRTLTEIKQSRVCIDLPGNGPFCTRLVDYFSVGACVVGPPHGTTFHIPLESGKHLAYCKQDMSDLVPICTYYLENKEARENLIRNSQLYFDRFLHRDQLAAYYLHEILKSAA